MKIIWTPLARDQVHEISNYIAYDNPSAARKWAKTILKKVKQLKDFPEIGRIVPEFNDTDIREIIFGNYRIIYVLKKQSVAILTVRHGRRLLSSDDIQ